MGKKRLRRCSYEVERRYSRLTAFARPYGYNQEFLLEQRLRDVMGIEIADGTAQVSKIAACREIFGMDYLLH